jgi:hypothetical protein
MVTAVVSHDDIRRYSALAVGRACQLNQALAATSGTVIQFNYFLLIYYSSIILDVRGKRSQITPYPLSGRTNLTV